MTLTRLQGTLVIKSVQIINFILKPDFILPTQDTPLNRYYYKNTVFPSKQNMLEMQ